VCPQSSVEVVGVVEVVVVDSVTGGSVVVVGTGCVPHRSGWRQGLSPH